MKRNALIVALAVALALVAVPAIGLAASAAPADTHAQTNGEANETDANATDANETAPGERLSGVVGVGEAELEGDLDQRTFGIQVAQAASQEAQADVVGDRLADVEQRLNDTEERKEALDQQLADGEISQGQYNAEVAKMAAQTETATQLVNKSGQVADQLPADLLEERGVNVEAIQTLTERAHELIGGEVAEIARGIAGDDIGQSPVDDRPVEVPDRPERPDTPGDDQQSDDDPADDDAPGEQSQQP